MAGRRSQLRRLAPCVALTVAAHAAVLALPMRPAATAGSAVALTRMQVRTIEASRPVLPPVAESAAKAAPKRVARILPEALQHKLARLEIPPLEPTPAIDPSKPLLSEPGWSLPGVADEDDVFLARSLLSVPPTPLAPVIIAYPEVAAMATRYSGELTLYIDESGTVVRVRAEYGALPPALEEAARNAFMSVRFSPGELAEHGAVKSRIRVEVVFEGGATRLLG
jgi:hypothetical protein